MSKFGVIKIISNLCVHNWKDMRIYILNNYSIIIYVNDYGIILFCILFKLMFNYQLSTNNKISGLQVDIHEDSEQTKLMSLSLLFYQFTNFLILKIDNIEASSFCFNQLLVSWSIYIYIYIILLLIYKQFFKEVIFTVPSYWGPPPTQSGLQHYLTKCSKMFTKCLILLNNVAVYSVVGYIILYYLFLQIFLDLWFYLS